MGIKGIHLSWIVVKDLQKAIDYYSRAVGLKVMQSSPEYGWAELQGEDGSILGIAQENDQEPIKAGSNAVITISVENLEKSKATMQQAGVRFLGNIIEIPGHVKLQSCVDLDGNHFQLVQMLASQ